MATKMHDLDELRHDVRQSIATILTLVAVTKHEVGDDPGRALKRLDQVAEQACALAGLLDDQTPKPAEPDVADAGLVGESTVRSVTAGYPGTVRLDTDGLAWVGLPPSALRRVVSNLVCNAMRAAGEDGVVQTRVLRGDTTVTVVVEDDGPGFGRLPVIHGIGLRSATRLVRRAGGRLDIGRSRLGGALFRVTLPAVRLGGEAFREDLAV
jgi:signal transduction histidine kinase